MSRHERMARQGSPSYPQFGGDEPCTELGLELFYERETDLSIADRKVRRDACFRCPMMRDCRKWGIFRERHGYWGGLTPWQREMIRQRQGLWVDEPQYAIGPYKEPILVDYEQDEWEDSDGYAA